MGTKTKLKTVGQRVKMWREKKGLSLQKLARMADVDARTLRAIENDIGKPWPRTITQLAAALGVKTNKLNPEEK